MYAAEEYTDTHVILLSVENRVISYTRNDEDDLNNFLDYLGIQDRPKFERSTAEGMFAAERFSYHYGFADVYKIRKYNSFYGLLLPGEKVYYITKPFDNERYEYLISDERNVFRVTKKTGEVKKMKLERDIHIKLAGHRYTVGYLFKHHGKEWKGVNYESE